MITESIILQELYVTSLSLTSTEKWRAAGSFTSTSTHEGLFTVLAVIALIVAVILLFWVFTRYRRSEHELNLKIAELTVNNIKLRQEKNELTAANEKLQQENTELSRKKIEALENIINAEAPTK
jgi:Tfp pilus assembly protein PilN